jgi:proline iminopeptidase
MLGLTLTVPAQDGPTKADFECLKLANSNKHIPLSDQSSLATYHQVWLPELRIGEFKSNGLSLAYELEGVGRDVVIVVHGGAGLPHEYFHPMLSSLSRYARLVYFDRRADMLSTRSVFEPASPSELADDIDALRKSLGLQRVTLLGHSFGGNIALTYALRYPSHVKRLILVGTSALVESQSEVEKRLAKSLSAEEAAAFYSNEGTSKQVSPCEQARLRYRALYRHYFHKVPDNATLDRNVYAVYFDALARKQLLMNDPSGFDLRSQLSRVTVPVMVVAGRHDEVTPMADATELAAGLPQGMLVVMNQSGHFPFFEENYMFTQWVHRFLDGTGDFQTDAVTSAPTNITSSGTQPFNQRSR